MTGTMNMVTISIDLCRYSDISNALHLIASSSLNPVLGKGAHPIPGTVQPTRMAGGTTKPKRLVSRRRNNRPIFRQSISRFFSSIPP